jgi:ABC-type transport system involved in Fe-S cluster assembly fused permease/ATPase subunit
MKIIMIIFLLFSTATILTAQTIDKAMLAKYSQRPEQEKIIDRQIVVLKLSAKQATAFKTVSFYYIDKALVIVNANINSSAYSLYRKVKPLKAEHEAAMKQLLTPAQLDTWKEERKDHGIVAQIIK